MKKHIAIHRRDFPAWVMERIREIVAELIRSQEQTAIGVEYLRNQFAGGPHSGAYLDFESYMTGFPAIRAIGDFQSQIEALIPEGYEFHAGLTRFQVGRAMIEEMIKQLGIEGFVLSECSNEAPEFFQGFDVTTHPVFVDARVVSVGGGIVVRV